MDQYGIFDLPPDDPDRTRLGTVQKFAGNKPAERWFASSAHDQRQGFRTLKAASAWLKRLHDEKQSTP
ncbi:hypothetical protein HNR01_001805 [Methylorubrum rhodesianum]|uniref:hypothetical protein n=1 Tax=Methylorubrum rhodesianum TaxID=29427 RepID=UPI001617D233|nr:hypothetical protein [Methylorubrum rhodesianum]MBB5762185.1 hypothetical protein [Methylorubrum rhodesianum]